MNEKGLSKLFKKYFPDEFEMNTESLKTKLGAYAKGRSFEYRMRNYYRKQGYFVLRSAQSKGPADLVALKKNEILFIQCKLGGWINKKEKEKLILLAKSVGAIPILATRPKFRKLEITRLTDE